MSSITNSLSPNHLIPVASYQGEKTPSNKMYAEETKTLDAKKISFSSELNSTGEKCAKAFHEFHTSMNYLVGDSANGLKIATSDISNLIQNGSLEDVTTKISGYDKEEVREKFAFKANGFQFVALNEETKALLSEIEANPTNRDLRVKLREEKLVPFLSSWGKEQGLDL